MHPAQAYAESLVTTYQYRPLPKSVKFDAHQIYQAHLNDFNGPQKRNTNINGIPVASDYIRVVIGDYGAYLEFAQEHLLVQLDIPEGQRWRFNEDFIKSRNLTIKYYWYEYNGKKVYLQLGPVKYADYQPGMFYISVLDFDSIEKEPI